MSSSTASTKTGKRKSSSMVSVTASSDGGGGGFDDSASTSSSGNHHPHHNLRHQHTGHSSSAASSAATWDCSVCTYKNNAEAFKCMICDTRKGTSTRKPRLNPQVVEMQEMIQSAILRNGSSAATAAAGADTADTESEKSDSRSLHRLSVKATAIGRLSVPSQPSQRKSSQQQQQQQQHSRQTKLPRLRNVDRSTARHIPVTANGVTVIITDFKPKSVVSKSINSAQNRAAVPLASFPSELAADPNADDSSASIASPPLPSCLSGQSLPPPSLTTVEFIPKAASTKAPSVGIKIDHESSEDLDDSVADRRSESPPQISPQKFD